MKVTASVTLAVDWANSIEDATELLPVPCNAFQKPPLTVSEPPLEVLAALGSAMVPSILRLPPALVPPPPPATCGSTAVTAAGGWMGVVPGFLTSECLVAASAGGTVG